MSSSLLLLEFNQVERSSIKGDCTIAGYEGHISLESFSWKLNVTNKKNEDKRTKLGELSVSKYYDTASVAMCNMMYNNNKFIKATLRFIDPSSKGAQTASMGSKFESIMEIEMLDGYIEKISPKASEDGKAISIKEEITLSFKKVKLSYYALEPNSKFRTNSGFFDAEQTVAEDMADEV